jgi:type I restriction enzyme M protein
VDTTVYSKLVSFIWSIADDCLRDVYVRGKYRDVILPMVVLRRIDTLLETSKAAVMEEIKFQQEELKLTEFEARGLQDTSGYVFYNTSKWTLQTLYDTATNSQQMLQANFDDYLNGFSPNVKEIIDKFKLRSQIRHMADKDVLLSVLEKFTSPNINFTPQEKLDSDGRKLAPLTNLGMGYVFEELIRKFNEENNEEAGEHFTPREVIELMTHLVFKPLQNNLPRIMTIYDPACGSGGMLTEAQNFIQDPNGNIRSLGDVYLYGKEINDETYAICKSDMMIKGNDPENIRCGSTLATDEFAGKNFHFMLSNPPYGKSWVADQKHIKDAKDVIDSRFIVKLNNYWGAEETMDATPRSSDGQLLFLMEMVSKMKPLTQDRNGSRIASVHNGSSLFTGDAGGGESNIRRYIIENDLLDAIIQLPNNLFYNTGITTYIWLLSNNKPSARKGKVQLIEASGLYRKLRKNLGQKNCEFAPEHIEQIFSIYQQFIAIEKIDDNSIGSKIFSNSDFGYYKLNIERPQRLKIQFTSASIEKLRFDKDLYAPMEYIYTEYGEQVYRDLSIYEKQIINWCEDNQLDLNAKNIKKLLNPQTWQKQLTILEAARKLHRHFGGDEFLDFNLFNQEMNSILKQLNIKLNDSDKNQIISAISVYAENAAKVIKKVHKLNGEKLDRLLEHLGCKEEDLADFGYYLTNTAHEYIEYESSSELRDTESIPLSQNILDYFKLEVKPHTTEAWINLDSIKIGYEISFNKYFYRHKPLRSIEEVSRDILELEKQSDGLIHEILGL